MCTKATGRSGAKEKLEHSLWLYCYVLSDSAFLCDRHSELEAVDNTSKCCENIHDSMLLDFYDLMQPKGSACCDVPAVFYEFVFCFSGDGQMASKSSRGNFSASPAKCQRWPMQLTPHCLLQQSASVGQCSSRHIDKPDPTARPINKPDATAAHAAELKSPRRLPGTQRRSHALLEPTPPSPP